MHLLLATIELRPYVFIFLAAFLFISIVNFGLRTTVLFTVLTYAVSLACEWSSVHNGFPFGLYHYLDATRGREIWIAGVPFMDSLSFTFLGFASYTVALLVASPLYRRGLDLRVLDTWKIRRSPRVWLMAALFMVMVDMVVDPLSVRGDRWFLGKIFWYDPPGPHFGVPITNYLGWFFVAVLTVAIFQLLDGSFKHGCGQTRRCHSRFPVARVARTDALRGHHRLRYHDALPHRCARYRLGQRFHLSAFCRADSAHRHTPGELWGQCRNRASSGRFSLRRRCICRSLHRRDYRFAPPPRLTREVAVVACRLF